MGSGAKAPSSALESGMTLERYELKYLVPRGWIEPICRFLEVYCRLDEHSAVSDDNFYVVNSLYFDSPGFEFLKQRMNGKVSRFNMRVRAYAGDDSKRRYLEVKHKLSSVVRKYRASVPASSWPHVLEDAPLADDSSSRPSNLELFKRLAVSHAVEPKVFTQYRRRAFVSEVDSYARATLDIDLKCTRQDGHGMDDGGALTNYDNETVFGSDTHGDASVVLELKCNVGFVPTWMLDLIATFELKQEGFSKYMRSALCAHGAEGVGYMVGDRTAGTGRQAGWS